jgi:hypothetical protein
MLARSILAAAGVLVGCQSEPSLLCDRSRVVWPYFADLDAADDVSPADGVQIDLDLRTSYLPGSVATLTVEPEEGDPIVHPTSAVVEDGELAFREVTVPLGRVIFSLAITNECGDASSRRQTFVWDGLGFPDCALTTGVEPAQVEALAPLGVLREEHDADPDRNLLQVDVAVDTGRPDMTVLFFLLELATGDELVIEEEAGDDRRIEVSVDLDEGEYAMRAVCHWLPEDLHPSSVTRRLFVDTVSPGCSLLAPTGRVFPADDLDDAEPGVQFVVRGRSPAPDVAGEAASFLVNGDSFDGGTLDDDGRAEAIATIDFAAGDPQEISFQTTDHAGNPCTATETF